jgi:hypothetical protein
MSTAHTASRTPFKHYPRWVAALSDKRSNRRSMSLSRWILLVLILATLGAPERASGQAKNASFNDAAGCAPSASRCR